MKKAVFAVLVLIAIGSVAMAGGDKNRGDKGKGSVHQVVGP